MPKDTLTAERVRELLDYDPDSGMFRWKDDCGRRHYPRAGDVAGCATGGYWCIRIDRTLHLAHRLAWLYVHGVWPNGMIDHRNEQPSDNRIANLREATNAQNMTNVTRLRKDNTIGLVGVHRDGNRFYAKIKANGKQNHLGTFGTPEEAHAAYIAAKRKLHPFWAER